MTINIVKVPGNFVVVRDNNIKVVSVAQQGIQGAQGLPGFADYKERNSDYYLTFGIDDVVGMDASNGNVSIFLPTSDNTNKGQKFFIKKIDTTSYSVLVKSTGGQPIDNLGSIFTILYSNDEFGFVSTGQGYKVI